jgi:hypothetical protein
MEEKVNTITVEALEWIRGKQLNGKQISRVAKWLLYNVFSIAGA